MFLTGFVGSWTSLWGFLLLFFVVPGLALILLTVCIVLTIRRVRAPLATDRARERLIAIGIIPAITILVIVLSLPALWVGSHLGSLSRLAINYGDYERIIAKARQSGSDNSGDDYGVTYHVDTGPPVRVAFNPDGFLDNWSGIIYDPTGVVMQADGFDPVSGKFHALDSVTKLFDGDLVGCRWLWGDYYRCSFT